MMRYRIVTVGLIEASYNADNPYHTAVHAADVLQATHCNIDQSPVSVCSSLLCLLYIKRSCPDSHIISYIMYIFCSKVNENAITIWQKPTCSDRARLTRLRWSTYLLSPTDENEKQIKPQQLAANNANKAVTC